jgi:2,3-bisphosphoglycerate-dependent phosphoglycerate mutase
MKACFLFMLGCVLLSCTPTRYYIVRHAEKESATMMSADVPLSEEGRQRALALKETLLPKKITHIYSTKFNRTIATAEPLRAASNNEIKIYEPADTTFINQLKQLPKVNVLIVGHSNTVDDLVNGLTGKNLLQDLPETQYGDLFVVEKRGKKYRYSKARFGL